MSNFVSLITPPAKLAVELDLIKDQINLEKDESNQDSLLKLYVQQATAQLDGKNGYLGRALITQKWRLVLDFFPQSKIWLPLPPLQTVNAVKWTDEDGTVATVSTDVYRVVNDREPGFIEMKSGQSWPSVPSKVSSGVIIEFTAGFGDDHDAIPADIKAYIAIQAAELYKNREKTVVGTSVTEVPYINDSLENYRITSAAGGKNGSW